MDETAHRFIERCFQPQDRLAFMLVGLQGTRQMFRQAREFGRLAPELTKANEAGANVYLSVNPLLEGAMNRRKEDVEEVRHLFLDFDAKAPEAIVGMLQSGRVPRINEIIRTSPDKAQALWRVSDFTKDAAESMMKGLVSAFGADPAATDVARVMRLPGFTNRKYEDSPYVSVTRVHRGVALPDQFAVFAPDAGFSPAVPGHIRAPRRNGGITQSDRDWADTRHHLKRGLDPAEMERKLMARRLESRDKSNPADYARRTVENAMKSLGMRL